MKKPFEEYLTFIENELGVQLLHWQKMALRAIYDGHCPYISAVRGGKVVICRAAELLTEEMNRDNGCLPAQLYKLDGYTADIVVYDELEKANK